MLIAIAVGGATWASEPLKGWVVDRNGAPVEGAKVWVKHQKNHTESNEGGEFCLDDVAAETICVKVKKKVYDISVGNRKSLYVVVSDLPTKDKEKKYEEDYGSRRIITGEELAKSGDTDLISALRGRFAGLKVDGNGLLRMNRACSLFLSIYPVWFIDGIPSDPWSISVNDVESVEIDKEGLGYGLYGANGVIIVKTKKAK